jgi:hypothetical protein
MLNVQESFTNLSQKTINRNQGKINKINVPGIGKQVHKIKHQQNLESNSTCAPWGKIQ